MKILAIGLGKMGAPMARHLSAAGHDVVGVEPGAERRAALKDLGKDIGFPIAASLDEAAGDGAERIVVSSLPDDAALIRVADQLGRSQVGTTWIDTSTVSLDASRHAATMCAARALPYLRAPISGNAPMAERAALTVLVSGDRGTYEHCLPLFACWGPKCIYLGEDEQARVAKLVVNLMVAGTSGMLAEALTLGQRGGIAWDDLWGVLEGSAVASPILLAKAPALRARDYAPTFTVAQMRKDLGLIRDVAAQLGVDVPIATIVGDAMKDADLAGDSDRDYAVIIRRAERRAEQSSNLPKEDT